MLANCIPWLAFSPLLIAQSFPLYELTEVLVQPLAGGHQIVEVSVWTTNPSTTQGWYLVHASGAAALPNVQLVGHSFVQIHLGVAGTDTPTNLYLPGFPTLATSDAIALYADNPSSDPSALMDFVSWGGATSPMAATAVQNGRWTSTIASAAFPAAPGATIANRTFTRSTANLIGPLAWYADTTPTLGAANDPGITDNLFPGCSGAAASIASVSLFDPGPWTGEVHVLPITSVPPFPGVAVLTFGLTATGPVPLDPIGLTGCFWYTTLDAMFLLQLPPLQNTIFFTYLIPNAPGLSGFSYYAQALVLNPAAPNPLQAEATNTVRMLIGSR